MIAINEHSFQAQAANIYDISARMQLLRDVIEALSLAVNSMEVVTCSNLCNAYLTPDITFNSWIHIRDDKEHDLRMFFIVTVKNGPFVDVRMRTGGLTCVCKHESQDVAYSSASGAAHQGGILASLQDSGPMSDPIITLQGCSPRIIEVNNYSNLSQIQVIDRVYVPTEKHERHGWGSLMDLDFETAQRTLRKGIAVGDAVYGKSNEKYYVFRSDNAGGFHGYSITRFDVPNKAKKLLDHE